MELGIGGLGYATEIGAGASAIVYRARQLELDREVAVKVLSVGDEAFVRRFAREAKTLGKLSQNPGIVTVYDTGVTGTGQPYLILELCEYSVLDRLNGPDGAFEPLDACRAAAQVADAVSDAHNNGVIHRDIKPGNVLVSQTGRYMVTDFGISTVTGATMGQTNSVGFTAGYVAPETLSGETAGTAADIYAIGATLFHMIAGRAPFVDAERHSNLLALAQRVIHDPVPDLRPHGVPDEVCHIIEGAMAKRPLDRPTAAQLRDQLRAVVDDLASEVTAVEIGAVDSSSAGVVIEADGSDDGRPSPLSGGVTTIDPPITGEDSDGDDGTVATEGRASHHAPGGGSDTIAGPTPLGETGIEPGDLSRTTVAEGTVPAEGTLPAGGAAPHGGPDVIPEAPANGSSRPATGGILSHQVVDPPPPSLSMEDRRYAFTTDDRRMLGPLVVGALVGLLALVGVGGYLISRAGDGGEQSGEGPRVETIDGPSTSISASGNEAIGRGSNGGRGTLEPGLTGNGSDTTDSTNQVADVVVPSMTNMTLAQARSELTALGFVPNPVDEESGSQAEGTVVRQSPSAGTARPRGSTITIYIARARPAETVVVPSVTGDTRTEAGETLAALGLEVLAAVTTEAHPTVADGLVIRSAPASGSEVNVGSMVSLVISSGPVPECATMVGLSENVATSQLEAAGLTVSATRQASPTVAVNDVISCTKTETTAALIVSSGPPDPAICAQVIGSQLTAATTALEAEGLSVNGIPQATDTIPAGEVMTCSIIGATAAVTYAVAVPSNCDDAVGRTTTEARALLQNLGFTEIVVNQTPSESVPEGEVIACATAGASATLTVSSGSENPTVPDVVGMKRAGGVATLRAAGFDVAPPVLVADEEPAGQILSTDPAGGTTAPAGSTVTITVSSGPDSTVAVPPLSGVTAPAADRALVRAGLTPNFATRELPADSPDIGRVVATNPVANTQVAPGSAVTVIIGVPEPDDGR